ncbi:hypothetical protein ACVHNB_23715 [Streptomyces sp. YJ-C3]
MERAVAGAGELNARAFPSFDLAQVTLGEIDQVRQLGKGETCLFSTSAQLRPERLCDFHQLNPPNDGCTAEVSAVQFV